MADLGVTQTWTSGFWNLVVGDFREVIRLCKLFLFKKMEIITSPILWGCDGTASDHVVRALHSGWSPSRKATSSHELLSSTKGPPLVELRA